MNGCLRSSPCLGTSLIALLVQLLVLVDNVQADPCSVCPNPADTISLPDKLVTFPGYDPMACSTLALLIPLALDETDSQCLLTQNISSICGCPTQPEACQLCPTNNNGTSPASSTISQNQALEGYPNDSIPTCELLEAYLQSSHQDSEMCIEGQMFAEQCGCFLSPATNSTDDDDDATMASGNDPTGAPAEDTGCNLCWDDSPITNPDVDVRWMLNAAISNFDDGTFEIDPATRILLDSLVAYEGPFTCTIAQTLIHQVFERNNEYCPRMQVFFGGLCGCPSVQNACEICPNDDFIPFPDHELEVVQHHRSNYEPTCGQLDVMMRQVTMNHKSCEGIQWFNYRCGCNESKRDYLGTGTSDTQKAMLAWIPRVTGFFSLMGCGAILFDIFKDKKKRRGSVYHELMISMTLFDIISSICWILSTLPIPEHISWYFGIPSNIYGAKGTDATCTAQGFWFQLGYSGSVFYNLSLTFYYLNVIVKNKRESEVKKMRPWLHVPPILVSLILAFAGIPFYEDTIMICQIPVPPGVDYWTLIIVFSIVPVGIVMLLGGYNMSTIYFKVRSQSRRASKWRISSSLRRATSMRSSANVTENPRATRTSGQGAASRMENAAFWQAFFYMLAFLLTWPLYWLSPIAYQSDNYTYFVFVVILAPLQGLFNSFVYFRPRYMSRFNKWSRKRASKREAKRTDAQRLKPSSAQLTPTGEAKSDDSIHVKDACNSAGSDVLTEAKISKAAAETTAESAVHAEEGKCLTMDQHCKSGDEEVKPAVKESTVTPGVENDCSVDIVMEEDDCPA